MIVADSIHPVRFVRGYWKYRVAVVVVLFAVEMANDYVNFDRRALSPTSIGLVVAALSIFLVFRVGEAYSRWWEARGHPGLEQYPTEFEPFVILLVVGGFKTTA